MTERKGGMADALRELIEQLSETVGDLHERVTRLERRAAAR